VRAIVIIEGNVLEVSSFPDRFERIETDPRIIKFRQSPLCLSVGARKQEILTKTSVNDNQITVQ
jgi:hypothetical protein